MDAATAPPARVPGPREARVLSLRRLGTRPLSHWWGDAGMAALVVALGVAEALGHATAWTPVQRVVILGSLAAAILIRNVHLGASMVICGAVFAAAPALGFHMDISSATLVGGLAIVWTLGARLTLGTSVWALVILLVTVSIGFSDPLGSLLWNTAVMSAVLLISRLLASRKRALTALAATARDLEASRDAEARAQVELERTRISRELHDVVAHAVSVMVVQAGAAQSVLASDPDRAHKALDAVQDTGREALRELRAMLATLRPDDGAPVLAPQPGLADVPALVDRVRGGGLPVDVVTEGPPRALAPAADLVAYRVVQESLTNVVRHAHATSARVAYRYGRDTLEIDIEDDGAPHLGAAPAHGSGLGLRGMRERVELCGGTFDAGPAPGHGFRVRASLPVVEP